MTERDWKARINLFSPGEGAYRVSFVGADPTEVKTTLLAGPGDRAEVALTPGRYTALVENLGAPGQVVRQVEFEAHASPDAQPFVFQMDSDVTLPIRAKQRPSRPSRHQGGYFLASDVASFDTTVSPATRTLSLNSKPPTVSVDRDLSAPRAIAIGVSMDKEPDRRGGWTGGDLIVGLRHDFSDGMILDIDRPAQWREHPRWRLTISVEGDAAWRAPIPLFNGGLEVGLRPINTAAGPDVSVTFTPRSAATAALVGSLQKAFPDETDKVLQLSGSSPQDAVAILAEKAEDPWAAAAAALLLARNGEIESVSSWAFRLAELFPWLPDAGVAASWAHAAFSGDGPELEAMVLSDLTIARRRGSPYFAASNTMALDMLATLAAGAEETSVRAGAKRERAIWARHSRRAMRTGAFLSWERPGPGLTSGRLPERSYRIIAKGMLSAETLFLT